jgi:hypothetical protein
MGGWTSTALIELADRRTERRGSKTLDLQSEFIMALQEFCMESRWEWRRKVATFNLQSGVWQYDLTALPGATFAVNDIQQVVKHGLKFYPNAGSPQNWAEITPMFEKEQQTAAIYSNTNVPAPAPPQQYFRMPGIALNMAIWPVPDQNYPATLDYWSVPNIDPDAVPEQIPLVPPNLHHVLLKKLEAEIFRYTLGEGTTKFQAAMQQYTMLLQKYQMYDAMTPGEQKDYSADDDYDSSWSTGHNAIQSTN